MTMPKPLSRSQPGARTSIAEPVREPRTWAGDRAGRAERSRPAIAAACGADAEVPKKGRKLLTSVETPSAAVRSGFWRTTPPVEEKLPGGAPAWARFERRSWAGVGGSVETAARGEGLLAGTEGSYALQEAPAGSAQCSTTPCSVSAVSRSDRAPSPKSCAVPAPGPSAER